jgi:hypothetical protein
MIAEHGSPLCRRRETLDDLPAGEVRPEEVT